MSRRVDYEDFIEYEEDDSNAISRCEECGELIYEDNDDAYIDDDGNYFCSLRCALNYYSLRKIDDYWEENNQV